MEALRKFKKHDNTPPAVGLCFLPFEHPPFDVNEEINPEEDTSENKLTRLKSIHGQKSIMDLIPTMRLTIKASYREDLEILVDPEYTIEDVKQEIYEKEGISPGKQTLSFNGHILKEDKTLNECQIPYGSTLHLIVRVNHSCFLPDTPITLKDGSTKIIKDLKVGELVLTHDTEKDILDSQRVLNVEVYNSDCLCEIDIECKKVICTPNHPFWVPGKGWKAVECHPGEKTEKLEVGDKLLDSGLGAVNVRSIRLIQLKNSVNVYNIHVEMAHNYFACGILVHNTQIFVRNMAGKTYALNIDLNNPIGKIKDEIFAKLQIPQSEQCLMFAGRVLKDNRKLADYNIKKENTLHLYPYCSNLLTSSVFEAENKFINLNIIYKSMTYLLPSLSIIKVKGLKQQIKSILDSNGDIELLFGGRILTDDEETLRACGLDTDSDILVIPGPSGGNCLRFVQMMKDTETKDLDHLKSSLKFFKDQQKINENWNIALKLMEKIEKIPYFHSLKPPELITIILWASGTVYEEVNETLMKSGDLSEFRVYFKYLMSGITLMPYYVGKCYSSHDIDYIEYKKGEIVEWKAGSVLSKTREAAQKDNNNKTGIFFEVNVVSARDFSAILTHLKTEGEIMIMPYSYFEVMDVIKTPNQPIMVKLREIPVPRGPKVLFWVDDNPQYNLSYAQDLEKMGISCVFCTSTKDALRVINNFRWLLYFEDADFRIVTDMVRYEDGTANYIAGVDLLRSLVKVFKFSYDVLVFCNDVKKAKEAMEKEDLAKSCRITSSERELLEFIKFVN